MVDVLRSCKTATFVLAEGEAPVTVRWYFAPEGAEWLGIPCAFTSSTWDDVHGLGSPPIGEQEGTSAWNAGANTGNYTGQCRVGTDEEYLHGAEPAGPFPPPLPSCCQRQPGALFYLRSDLAPVPPVVPAGIVGPWSNQGGGVAAQFALSPEPGTGPVQQLVNFTTPGPVAFQDGFLQYVSPPLGPGRLSARTWTLSTGFRAVLTPGFPDRLQFRWSVSICDLTGSLKQVLIAPSLMGPIFPLDGVYHSALLSFPVPDIDLLEGDLVVVELGAFYAHVAHVPTRFTFQFWDCGTTPITAPDVGRFNPAALLDYTDQPEETDLPLPGMLFAFAGTTVPAGYLLCDGAAYSTATYPALFAAIGTHWGTPGAGQFNVPDLRDRTAIGISPGGLGSDRPTARALGATGGEEKHTLIILEMPVHSHALLDPGHYHGMPGPFVYNAPGTAYYGSVLASGLPLNTRANTNAAGTGDTVATIGGDGPHNTMQPFAAVRWVIKT